MENCKVEREHSRSFQNKSIITILRKFLNVLYRTYDWGVNLLINNSTRVTLALFMVYKIKSMPLDTDLATLRHFSRKRKSLPIQSTQLQETKQTHSIKINSV